jgi:hypothetical protein
MIHRAGEVLVEDQGYAAGLAETAIGEANAAGLDERFCRMFSPTGFSAMLLHGQ